MSDVSIAPPAAPDPAVCPLCGQGNRCAQEAARTAGTVPGECWCMRATFDSGVLDRVPPGVRGLACVCERCARGMPTQD